MKDSPYFYPTGEGGVDFPAIVAYLRCINWRGYFDAELDTLPWRPPKESARITADDIRNTLKIEL
jgi:sugar phosphate isomerase/epimerase